MATETLYLRADEIKSGDILPDVSRMPVSHAIVDPHSHVTFRFTGTEYTRHASYGGPDYGYECFRVEREAMPSHLPESALDPAPEGWEDYELVKAAQHAASAHLDSEL
ncbi:hypothetical protein SEA_PHILLYPHILLY_113 [Microbacterium phage PhillyPhilly]|nr:hypothetical protein SEA_PHILLYPHILLY_3 [Microbacterium phage PhillyPhilly]QDH92262.1 hypothetical protein SEA_PHILLYPHILLY_113 [Microbacterium phage PhillyPhilly]